MYTFVQTIDYTAEEAYEYSSSRTIYDSLLNSQDGVNGNTTYKNSNSFSSTASYSFEETISSNGARYTKEVSETFFSATTLGLSSHTELSSVGTQTVLVTNQSTNSEQNSGKTIIEITQDNFSNVTKLTQDTFITETVQTFTNSQFFDTTTDSMVDSLVFTSTTTYPQISILSVIGLDTYLTVSVSYQETNLTFLDEPLTVQVSSVIVTAISQNVPQSFDELSIYEANDSEMLWKLKDEFVENSVEIPLDMDYLETFSRITVKNFEISQFGLNGLASFTNNTTITSYNPVGEVKTFTVTKINSDNENVLKPIVSSYIQEEIYITNISLQPITQSSSFSGNYSFVLLSSTTTFIPRDSTSYYLNSSFAYLTTERQTILGTITKYGNFEKLSDSSQTVDTSVTTTYLTQLHSEASQYGYNNINFFYKINQGVNSPFAFGDILNAETRYDIGYALPNTNSQATIGSNISFNFSLITINPYGKLNSKSGIRVPLPLNYTDIVSINTLGQTLSADQWTTITVDWSLDSLTVSYQDSNSSSVTTISQKLSVEGSVTSHYSTSSNDIIGLGGSNYPSNQAIIPYGYYSYTEYNLSSSTKKSEFVGNNELTSLDGSKNLSVFEIIGYGLMQSAQVIQSVRNDSNLPTENFYYQVKSTDG